MILTKCCLWLQLFVICSDLDFFFCLAILICTHLTRLDYKFLRNITTAYPLQASGFISNLLFGGIRVSHPFSFLYYVYCFLCLCSVLCIQCCLCLWILNRYDMSNLYRGPSIDASYQVSVSEEKIRMWKVNRRRCQVMAKVHMAFKPGEIIINMGWGGG